MTNQELLEIIKLAKENHVNVNTLRRILRLMEQDGEIKENRISQIKILLQESQINNSILLTILEKSYQKRTLNWDLICTLNKHIKIRNYVMNQDYEKEKWKIILKTVSLFPEEETLDNIYIKWLKKVDENHANLEEFTFFHKLFTSALGTDFIFTDWYFSSFLDKEEPLENRLAAFSLINQNILNMLKSGTKIEDSIKKAQKILEAYEKLDLPIANLYATIITCIIDMDIPLVSQKEQELYEVLLKNMCLTCSDASSGMRFLNSKYYALATKKEISPKWRLLFIKNIFEKEIIFEDAWLEKLWELGEIEGLASMLALKQVLLKVEESDLSLWEPFLFHETNPEVLNAASLVLRKRGVRRDKESVLHLIHLKTSKEKLAFLHKLDELYPEDKENLTSNINETYDAFLNSKIGLTKLQALLEESIEMKTDIVRVRSKENGSKI